MATYAERLWGIRKPFCEHFVEVNAACTTGPAIKPSGFPCTSACTVNEFNHFVL